MKAHAKIQNLRILKSLLKHKLLLPIILLIVGGLVGVIALQYKSSDPEAALFQDILKVAPKYYGQHLKLLGASPVKSDTRAGCIETYKGYPPGEKSPSANNPYNCLIHVSKSFAAPDNRGVGSDMVKEIAKESTANGFVSKEGIVQNESGTSYYATSYYKGRQECIVEIAYFYAKPLDPVSKITIKPEYMYDLNCGGETYPFVPPGYQIGLTPQAGI